MRYWDGDSYDQILLLTGHTDDVTSLALSPTDGGFLLTGSSDRSVRVYERTHDMVFVEEEKEMEIERQLDKADDERYDSYRNLKVGSKAWVDEEDGGIEDEAKGLGGKAEEAVRKSVLSVKAGDRVLEVRSK